MVFFLLYHLVLHRFMLEPPQPLIIQLPLVNTERTHVVQTNGASISK